MPNGRPGDNRMHDVLHHKLEVFGPACDELIRDLAARLPPDRMRELDTTVETWRFHKDGTPADTDALFRRLVELRDRVGTSHPGPTPPPAPRGPVPKTSPQPNRQGGRARAVAIGVAVFLLCGTAASVAAALLVMIVGGEPPIGDVAMGWAIAPVFGLMPIVFLLVGGALGIVAARRAWPR